MLFVVQGFSVPQNWPPTRKKPQVNSSLDIKVFLLLEEDPGGEKTCFFIVHRGYQGSVFAGRPDLFLTRVTDYAKGAMMAWQGVQECEATRA